MWAVYYPCDLAGCKWADSHALWASLAHSYARPEATSNCCSDQHFKIKRSLINLPSKKKKTDHWSTDFFMRIANLPSKKKKTNHWSTDFFMRIARANRRNWNGKPTSRLPPRSSARQSPHARPSSRGTDQRLGMRGVALGRGHARPRRRGEARGSAKFSLLAERRRRPPPPPIYIYTGAPPRLQK